MKLLVNGLSKSYSEKLVLDCLNFTFESGKIYGLLGRNGAGKTTFFNCLNGDVSIDQGKILLEDNCLEKLKSSDIGYVLSTPVVPEFLTAREFLQFFLEIHQDSCSSDIQVDDYFDLFKIELGDRDKLLKEYSHGMKNKMQMLINFICQPKVILLDEPLTSLDIVVQEEMKDLLRKFKKDHIIIFSTHILELAMDLCDEVVILNHKKLELVEKKNLSVKKYKEKIIHCLRDDRCD